MYSNWRLYQPLIVFLTLYLIKSICSASSSLVLIKMTKGGDALILSNSAPSYCFTSLIQCQECCSGLLVWFRWLIVIISSSKITSASKLIDLDMLLIEKFMMIDAIKTMRIHNNTTVFNIPPNKFGKETPRSTAPKRYFQILRFIKCFKNTWRIKVLLLLKCFSNFIKFKFQWC